MTEEYPAYAPSEEHELLRATVRELAEAKIAPAAADVDENSRFPQEALDALTGAGLHAVHIPEYSQGTWTNHAARRKGKLLLNREEIDKIERNVSDKGYTVVPLALYFLNGRAKVEIALGKGKKTWDKRHSLAERQATREVEQAVGRRLKGMD